MSNSLLQKTAASFAASASARTLQYASNVTAGSLLTCWVPTNTAGTSVTVSDNVNGSWTQAGTTVANGGKLGSWWYYKNSAGGSQPTVTVTPSQSALVTIMLHEHSVTSPTGVTLDSSIQNTGASGVAMSTGTCPVSGSGELVLAGASWQATAATGASGGGFVFEQAVSTNQFGVTADDVNASANEACTFSPNPTSGWAAMAVSFNTGSAAAFDFSPLLRRARRARAFLQKLIWGHYQMKFRPFPVMQPTPLPVLRRQSLWRPAVRIRRNAVAALIAAPPAIVPVRLPVRQITRQHYGRRNAGHALFSSVTNNVTQTVLVTSPRKVR
jgi:hypothetical protein